MAADKNSDKNIFGRPRRSSFVAPAQENSDFVPVLPAVGSAPIPAAADVNYFPTVETGQPSLREPEPPARLVVPTRKSMSEEEIANAFVDATEMTSAEQIAMLDAQVTLREDDLRTAKEFVAVLRTANPAEAEPLLDELKVKFADVDPEIERLSLDEEDTPEPTTESDAVDAALPMPDVPVSTTEISAEPAAPSWSPTPAVATESDPNAVSGRYRGWSVVITLAAIIATLVPATTAILTTFGAPIVDAVPALIGSNGIVVALVATLVSLPLIVMARAVPARNGLTWSAALRRVAGSFGGTVVTILTGIAMVVGLISVLVSTTQGVGTQLGSIPGVTSALAGFAPQAHVSVLLVSALAFTGFVISALPRAGYRAIILLVAGFTIVGPASILLTGLAVVFNTASGTSPDLSTIVISMGIVPIIVILLAAVDSGLATVLRRDERKIHGLWLYIGLTLGVGFAAWALVSRMGNDALGSVFVGSNPALHVIAPSNELAFIIGATSFAIPIVLLTALAGRSLMMTISSDDRQVGAEWFRIIVVLIPVVVAVLDITAAVGDITAGLPGVTIVSVPIMVTVGLLAGASVTANRERAGWARIVTFVFGLLFTIVGLAASLWALPALAPVYDSTIAPLVATFGISGSVALVVPVGVLVGSFVVSLVVSAVGSIRPNRTA